MKKIFLIGLIFAVMLLGACAMFQPKFSGTGSIGLDRNDLIGKTFEVEYDRDCYRVSYYENFFKRDVTSELARLGLIVVDLPRGEEADYTVKICSADKGMSVVYLTIVSSSGRVVATSSGEASNLKHAYKRRYTPVRQLDYKADKTAMARALYALCDVLKQTLHRPAF